MCIEVFLFQFVASSFISIHRIIPKACSQRIITSVPFTSFEPARFGASLNCDQKLAAPYDAKVDTLPADITPRKSRKSKIHLLHIISAARFMFR